MDELQPPKPTEVPKSIVRGSTTPDGGVDVPTVHRTATTSARSTIPPTPETLPQKLPEGFRWMKVPVSNDEAARFASRGARLSSGKAWESLRRAAGLPQYPRGLKAAVAAMDPADKEIETDQ